ncbi:MAG: hypothetical protein C0502_06600 [Opitutus sp.]|nr:hypothetical protein [Opitutus sp.]
MTVRVRPVVRWLSDCLRFALAMFYWNARKTVYVRRGRRGHCPCHHPSDDPIPGYVRCQAVLLWEQPARFRPVCPLLAKTGHGWCCSVKPEQVRAYWGRVFAWVGIAGVAVYFFTGAAVFTGLRWVSGVPLRPAQVFWPGKWGEIRTAQADTFFAQAIDAFRRGELNEAFLNLVSARQRDPRHYAAGLLLAQITMFEGSAAFSDDLFTRLLREHPAERPRTAVTYHDTLLSLDRLDRVAQLSLEMAVEDSPHAAVWVHSLLAALRRLPDPEPMLSSPAAALARLAPHARMLVEAERRAAAGDRAGAVALLRAPFRGPLNPIYMRQQVERLAGLGERRNAQLLLDFYGPAMGDFEHTVSQFALDAAAGDDWAAQASFRRLLAYPLGPAQVDRLTQLLVRHPQPGCFRELDTRVRALPALREAPVSGGLWAAALLNGAAPEAAHWRAEGRRLMREDYPQIAALDFASRDLTNPASVAHVINTVTLPREIVLALLSRAPPPVRRALP